MCHTCTRVNRTVWVGIKMFDDQTASPKDQQCIRPLQQVLFSSASLLSSNSESSVYLKIMMFWDDVDFGHITHAQGKSVAIALLRWNDRVSLKMREVH